MAVEFHAVWPHFVELSYLLDSNLLTIAYIMIVIGLRPKTQTALMTFLNRLQHFISLAVREAQQALCPPRRSYYY